MTIYTTFLSVKTAANALLRLLVVLVMASVQPAPATIETPAELTITQGLAALLTELEIQPLSTEQVMALGLDGFLREGYRVGLLWDHPDHDLYLLTELGQRVAKVCNALNTKLTIALG